MLCSLQLRCRVLKVRAEAAQSSECNTAAGEADHARSTPRHAHLMYKHFEPLLCNQHL